MLSALQQTLTRLCKTAGEADVQTRKFITPGIADGSIAYNVTGEPPTSVGFEAVASGPTYVVTDGQVAGMHLRLSFLFSMLR